jgi:hypothetical protein
LTSRSSSHTRATCLSILISMPGNGMLRVCNQESSSASACASSSSERDSSSSSSSASGSPSAVVPF